MNYNSLIQTEAVEQMSLPLFQPLRLWSPRPVKTRPSKCAPALGNNIPIPVRIFAMKGGYVSDSDGVRRMVIAGKIFKGEER